MRTVTKTIYTFDELSDDAKERAREWYRSCGDTWGWQSEWWNSAKEFSRIAPIKIREADYERGHVSIEWTGPNYALRFDHSDNIAELTGLRAWKWLSNNGWFDWARKNSAGECTMTGYCGDCSFSDALEPYERNPRAVPDLKQVFYEMAQAWVFAARRDMEHSYSDEAVDESIIANEYEFDSEGNPA